MPPRSCGSEFAAPEHYVHCAPLGLLGGEQLEPSLPRRLSDQPAVLSASAASQRLRCTPALSTKAHQRVGRLDLRINAGGEAPVLKNMADEHSDESVGNAPALSASR